MVSSDNFQKAVGLINKSNSILITTHTRPDGDAAGSIAAIAEAMLALGKNVNIILPSELPEWYAFLFTEKPPLDTVDNSPVCAVTAFAELGNIPFVK